MKDNVVALMQAFGRIGYEAYYGGERCRNEVYNNLMGDMHRIPEPIATIVTSATPTQIQKVLPRAKVDAENPYVYMVEFGGIPLQVVSYHTVSYDAGNKAYIYKQAHTLAEDNYRLGYTINCMARDAEGKNYFAHNARLDMLRKTIKTILPPEEAIANNPMLCYEAYVLVAQTGFVLDAELRRVIKHNLANAKKLPMRLLGQEIRKIIRGNYASMAITLMRLMGAWSGLLPTLQRIDVNAISQIELITPAATTELEMWAVLYQNNATAATKELGKLQMYTTDKLEMLRWLINNGNIYDADSDVALRHNIVKALVNGKDIHYMRKLVLMLNHMHIALRGSQLAKQQADKLLFQLYCRPYYIRQIAIEHITDQQKQQIIDMLIDTTANYPKNIQDIMKMAVAQQIMTEEEKKQNDKK